MYSFNFLCEYMTKLDSLFIILYTKQQLLIFFHRTLVLFYTKPAHILKKHKKNTIFLEYGCIFFKFLKYIFVFFIDMSIIHIVFNQRKE